MEKKTAVKKSNIFFGFMLFVNINNKIVCCAYRFGYCTTFYNIVMYFSTQCMTLVYFVMK